MVGFNRLAVGWRGQFHDNGRSNESCKMTETLDPAPGLVGSFEAGLAVGPWL